MSNAPKRFLVFAFTDLYPSGGLSDVDSRHDTFEEAMTRAKEINTVIVYVWDSQTDETHYVRC